MKTKHSEQLYLIKSYENRIFGGYFLAYGQGLTYDKKAAYRYSGVELLETYTKFEGYNIDGRYCKNTLLPVEG